jgi:hypothetical protein
VIDRQVVRAIRLQRLFLEQRGRAGRAARPGAQQTDAGGRTSTGTPRPRQRAAEPGDAGPRGAGAGRVGPVAASLPCRRGAGGTTVARAACTGHANGETGGENDR